MKKTLSRFILRSYLRRLSTDPHAFNRLMADAVRLQLGRMPDDEFRQCLERFYQSLDPESIKTDIDFASKAARLDRPGGYKTDIMSVGGKSSARPGRFDLWGRRFGLLRHLGIRSDVLILRAGERIPPHGHRRVVSGFYVLEGRVAIRHYNRVGQAPDGLLVRKALDTVLGPAGFTTNSEGHHDIHWLQGIADKSFLFRVTVVDTPSPVRDAGPSDSRLYIDPTGEPDASGIIAAPYVSESDAKRLTILSPVEQPAG